jgi:hypothetical protein
MRLEDLQSRIARFETEAGFSETSTKQLVAMLKEELALLESGLHNKKAVDHELTDLLVLIVQIANRNDTDFDAELETWFEKSEKYKGRKIAKR